MPLCGNTCADTLDEGERLAGGWIRDRILDEWVIKLVNTLVGTSWERVSWADPGGYTFPRREKMNKDGGGKQHSGTRLMVIYLIG